MSAMFNQLRRGHRYTFVFGGGLHAICGVFHEYLPDGTLRVVGSHYTPPAPDREYHLNPAQIVYARKEGQ